MFKICTHCTPAHRKPLAMNRRKCPTCKAGSWMLRPATDEEVAAETARKAKVEAFIETASNDQAFRAWETAMGMRGYAGSPAEREERV